jgi:hypothetical protein
MVQYRVTLSAILLPGQHQRQSSVPASNHKADGRGAVPGCAQGLSEGHFIWTEARATMSLRSFGLAACTIMATLWSATGLLGAVRAEPASVIQQASGLPGDPLAHFVAEASQRFGIPALWIRAVMRVESVDDVHATSPKGAMGFMQIMPETWAELRARYHLGADPYDPRDNILAGAAFLREMHDHYGSPGFLAAYNAGPTRYEEHLATGRELPAETQAYVAMLAPMIENGQVDHSIITSRSALSWRQAPLFVEHAPISSAVGRSLLNARLDRPPSGRAIADLSALSPRAGDLFVRRASEVSSP